MAEKAWFAARASSPVGERTRSPTAGPAQVQIAITRVLNTQPFPVQCHMLCFRAPKRGPVLREEAGSSVTGFILLRVRAHRLLLAASLLAVLLTTCVLAVLVAFSGAVGKAALQHSLGHRDAGAAALVVSAHVPSDRRHAAAEARGAWRTADLRRSAGHGA